ncbi:MAG TPA: hypothetical protein PKU99_02580, partial [Candidatus Saccharicenans sp.]|nr:hypothetical protein [Candidatus Saccharicenans sp.]
RFLSGNRYTRGIRSQDLGVPLGQGPTTIYAEQRGSRRLPEVSILDLRLEKKFRISRTSLGVFVDLFNVFNDNKATSVYTISSNPGIKFETMQSIMDPRILRIGARFEW